MITDTRTGVRVVTAPTEMVGRKIVAVSWNKYSGLLMRLDDKSGEDVAVAFEIEDGYEDTAYLPMVESLAVRQFRDLGFITTERCNELLDQDALACKAAQAASRREQYEKLKKEFEPDA